MQSRSRARSGELIHRRYRVVRIIGTGGMGAVYEAVDERLAARVALKESFAEEPELKQQFEREARLLAGLKHPALPRVTDYFSEHNHGFLVMEYIDGDSLADVVSNKAPLPVQQVIAWADQVLDVLIYLHATDRRIVHRDIKPHNLRVTSAGIISLLDFGLAKVTDTFETSESDAQSVHGYTRWYSPIEQIEASGTSERSDIYALGATLYHLLTGVRPEDSARRAKELVTIGVDCLQRADGIVPAVGEDLARVIQRAMAVRSEQRYQTAEEFREALRRLGRVANTTANIVAPPESLPEPAMRAGKRFVLLSVAAIVVISGLIFGWRFLRQHIELAVPNLQNVAALGVTSSEAQPRKLNIAAPPKTKSTPVNRTVQPAVTAIPERKSQPEVPQVIESRKPKPRETREMIAPAERQKTARAADFKPLPQPQPKPSVTPTHDLDAPRIYRAPDGTEVVKYKDGRIRVLRAGDRGGQR